MIYLILIILAFLCWAFPAWVQLFLTVVNLFLPDPLPYVDEVIQVVGLVKVICSRKDGK